MSTARNGSLVPFLSGRNYWWYLLPGAALLTLIILVPLGWNIFLSFTDYRGIVAPRFTGLDNWIALAGDERFWLSFRNSVAMILAMVIAPTALGLVIAAALFDVVGRKFGGRLASFLRATYYLPQILPSVIAAIVIGWILRPENGALNTILEAVGLGQLAGNWLGSPDTALGSMMVVLVWIQIGYPVVIFMAALQRVDPELYEAAEIDGAGRWRQTWHITLPAIRPTIVVMFILSIGDFLELGFEHMFLVLNSLNREVGEIFDTYVFTTGIQNGQMSYAAAVGLFKGLVGLLLVIAANKLAKRFGEEGVY